MLCMRLNRNGKRDTTTRCFDDDSVCSLTQITGLATSNRRGSHGARSHRCHLGTGSRPSRPDPRVVTQLGCRSRRQSNSRCLTKSEYLRLLPDENAQPPQADHAIPRAQDGNATFDNGQTTCPWCNASKGARDFPVNPPGATISYIASALRAGTVQSSDLPISVLDRGEGILGFDTRSMLALRQANIPVSDWTLIDQSGSEPFESILSQRLAANGLTNAGTDSLRITGAGPGSSWWDGAP
jgi:HNH endonuclease